jgi:hypothetical protein
LDEGWGKHVSNRKAMDSFSWTLNSNSNFSKTGGPVNDGPLEDETVLKRNQE